MDILELFLTAVALSMDAFAVAICKGLSMKRINVKNASIVGLYFGLFQALMPLIGYFVGIRFQGLIMRFDHWLVFVLLCAIGVNMICESRSKEVIPECGDVLNAKSMLPLALATSIDALAVGIGFAFLQMDILSSVSMIGITTFILSIAGVKIGSVFGAKYKARAEVFGGVVLILIGTKILLEHLDILTF